MADEMIAGNTQTTGDATAAAATTAPATAPAAATTQQATDAQVTQPTGTPPDAGTKPAGDTPSDTAADKPAGAPEKYEFKAPEGAAFDDKVIGVYSEVARELNLPQDAAQKMLDKVAPVIASQQLEAIKTAQSAWLESTKSDKEFGGERLSENVAVAKKALDAFGTPELRQLLDDSGLGNHPEVVRLFYRAGKAISEDRLVPGGTRPTGPAKDPATALYGNQSR